MSDEFKGSWGTNSQITVTNMMTDENKPACTFVGGPPSSVIGCDVVQQSPDALEGWVEQKHTNCYDGNGASAVPPDAYAPAEGITPVACMAACASSAIPCTAVVTSSTGGCWLRTDIVLDSCQEDADFDVWFLFQATTPHPHPHPHPDPTPAPHPDPTYSGLIKSTFKTSSFHDMCLGLETNHAWEHENLSVEWCPDHHRHGFEAPQWEIHNGQLVYAGAHEAHPLQRKGKTLCAVMQNLLSGHNSHFLWLLECSQTSDQTWSFDESSGELSVESAKGKFCLDMPHPKHPAPHTRVLAKACGAAESQKWSFAPSSEEWVMV